jgi:hypothetical protein
MKNSKTGKGKYLFVAGLVCACGGSPATHDGGNGGATGFDANREPGQTPIVDRPTSGAYSCSVTRDRTSHSPRAWTGLSALQPIADGSLYLARVEWDTSSSGGYYSAPHSFLVSPFAVDGSLGSPTTVPVDNVKGVAALATAPQGQGFVLAWADTQALRFAAFDANGVLVGQPKIITVLDRDADTGIGLRMAADTSGGGFALAISARKNAVDEAQALFLGPDGVARGSIRRLGSPPSSTNSYSDPMPYVAATTDGYVFVWNRIDGKTSSILFAKTDALGNETVSPRAIVSTDSLALGYSGFASGGTRIVEIAGGFVAAWSESHAGEIEDGGYSFSKGAWSVVRLTRLDSQGAPVGMSATMRPPEADVDEVEPVLTPSADTLAVSWSRGSHIYMCGGCVPDHRIDLLLIDPASFVPVSNVVTVTNGGGLNAGGLLRKQVAATGSLLLTLYDREFHTSADPGSAVFTCVH